MRVEAGYHLLDKSKVDIIDQNVRDLKNVQKTLHKYKGKDDFDITDESISDLFSQRMAHFESI